MLNLQKYFGQNFLIDNNIINKIISESDIDKAAEVIEIGPGKGALTLKLIEKAQHLTLIEADKLLAAELTENSVFPNKNIQVFNADAVAFNYEQLQLNNKNTVIISNLPYSCASQIIIRMIELHKYIRRCVFMIQKEMAERITAISGTKNYNAFTVLLNCFFDTRKLFDVSPNCFQPRPKVISTVIKMTPLCASLINQDDYSEFSRFIHSAFGNKRKTLVNSLVNNFSIDKSMLLRILIDMNISENTRAEQLDTTDFINIFRAVTKIKS